MTKWKVGDWAIFGRDIVQIKRLDDYCEVSDGSFSTSGNLVDRLRPLTLDSKRSAEWFDFHYKELDKIKGSRGFNFPDINQHFNNLCLKAIDGGYDPKDSPHEKVHEFIRLAGEYKPRIQGIELFRA